MGYCSRIYVVKKYDDWYETVFVFNMGRVFELYDMVKDYPIVDSKREFYGDNDEVITEDKYGEPLTEIPIDSFTEILRYLKSRPSCHYTVPAVLEALETIISMRTKANFWGDVVCLHYGY